MQLTAAQARARAGEVRETSSTILRGCLPGELIDALNAAFQPLLHEAVEHERDNPNRGPERYYVTLPFQALWADT